MSALLISEMHPIMLRVLEIYVRQGWTHTGGIQSTCWPHSVDSNGNLVPLVAGHDIQSGHPHDAAYAWQTYWSNTPLSIEDLEEAVAAQTRCNTLKEYARQLVADGKFNGREILSETIRYANSMYNYTDSSKLSDDVSCAITGARGPNTIFDASAIGVGVFGYTTQEVKLGKGGWNADYDDNSNNQAFHVWSYVNTVAQGGNPGVLLSATANAYHECWDPFDSEGRSTQDANLAWAGVILGYAINTDRYSPDVIADWIDTWLGDKSWKDLLSSPAGQEIAQYITGSVPLICPYIDKG